VLRRNQPDAVLEADLVSMLLIESDSVEFAGGLERGVR
jgi:hypothetical protein